MKKKKKVVLNGRQARFLRGLGHHLRSLATVGKEGLSDNLIKSVDAILAAHELVKVKVGQGCELDRREVAALLSERTGSGVAQVLGRTILLFRPNPERDEAARIQLP